MNIWGGQIRGALFNLFVVKKCPFLYLPDAALSFYNKPVSPPGHILHWSNDSKYFQTSVNLNK